MFQEPTTEGNGTEILIPVKPANFTEFKNAVAIAELHYSDIFKQVCKAKNVRSNDYNSKETECALFYWDKAGLFADLNLKLQNGSFEE